MRIFFLPVLLAVVLFAAPLALATENRNGTTLWLQPDPEEFDIDPYEWGFGLRMSLTGSQAAYRNWSQGGVDNISLLGSVGFSAAFEMDRYLFTHSTALRYGQSRLGDGDFIKSDDIIRLRNQLRRRFADERFSAIFNVNLDTQFDKGYDPPIPEDDEPRVVISRFFAPAYISQVLGLSYNPDRYFRSEAGVAMRQTIVHDTDLSPRFGLDPGDNFRNEAGISLLIGYERQVMENIFYSGFAETFTNVNKSISSTDVLIVNELSGQINRYISTNFELALVYDDDITDELQVKQIISVGFSYNFFGN